MSIIHNFQTGSLFLFFIFFLWSKKILYRVARSNISHQKIIIIIINNNNNIPISLFYFCFKINKQDKERAGLEQLKIWTPPQLGAHRSVLTQNRIIQLLFFFYRINNTFFFFN